MIYLLDTHTLIWWLKGAKVVPVAVRTILDQEREDVAISLVTPWEIAIKANLGKLEDIANFQKMVTVYDFTLLSIDLYHIEKVKTLPHHHRDPFDRMLIAQALTEDLTLISNEEVFDAYGVKRVWD